jgi:hypothetical protein
MSSSSAARNSTLRRRLEPPERTRYVKLKTLVEAQEPEMHKWIEQAGRVPGWKLNVDADA